MLEFNARFGDPETQVILPLLESDFAEEIYAVATGTLADLPPLEWRNGAAVSVVLTSGGYPGPYRRGLPIDGIDTAPDDLLLFHAGTARDDQGRLVTAGGRVLNVVGLGDDLATARERAYAGVEAINFDGKHARSDIGLFGVS